MPETKAQTMVRARRLEERPYEPSWYTRRDRFWAVIAHARNAKRERLLRAIRDFARPALGKAGYGDQLWAWTVALGDVHIAFVGSIPDLRADGEHLVSALDLPRYMMVEHNVRPGYDRFAEYDGDELRICSPDGNDFAAEIARPFPKGSRTNQTGPWQLLERRTGIGLTALRAAMSSTRLAWVVLDGTIVLPGAVGSASTTKRNR